ncbi:hypothetical protein ACIPSE_42445 [Streptomyces sp. NPDC090106]|uniref:hypothetical protein n=1 Tax=Streptomyces sp. NPDC090106 TaxID=3365946 RepID=UPI0038027FE1
MTTLTATVVRILHWATSEPAPGGADPPPPTTPAGTASGGADPVVLLERLARVTAARLHLSDPPLGDPGPAGPEPLLIAAALALRDDPERALQAAGAVAGTGTVRDLLARHALVARALATAPLDPGLRTGLLRASPLTALFDRPPPGTEERCGQLFDRLVDHAEGRRTAVAALAAPPPSPEAARHRAALLRRFRFTPGERTVVYEVYETALLRHRDRYREHTDDVRRLVRDSPARLLDDDERGRWARATLDWWEPLAVLARRHPEELRSRALLRDYRTGVALHRFYGRVREFEGLREVLDR